MERNLTQLAEYVGVCRKTISNILDKNDIKPTRTYGSHKLFDDETSDIVKNLYNKSLIDRQRKYTDLIGERFDRLLVKDWLGAVDKGVGNIFLCMCDCGNETTATYHELTSGGKRSCGCLRKEVQLACHTKHGDSYSRLYKIYRGMLSRCYNTNQIGYKNYWGRGITVCDEWQDYKNFREWALTHGYNDNLTIDRIDNDKGYSPDNCRWITSFEQASNQRTNKNITINGETHTTSEWCRRYGISRGVVWHRMNDYNWDAKKALETPVGPFTHMITYNGKTKSLREWSNETGIPLNTLRLRFGNKWPIDKMLTQPHQVHNMHKQEGES